MRTAYAAGQWQRIQRTKRGFPYLLYGLGPSEVHRDQHVAWAGTILPVDDPWWDTHFPPNGWGCKCHVRSVGSAERKRLMSGEDKLPRGTQRISTERPPDIQRDWVNRRTGEVHTVPEGIDPSWDWNAGKHRDLGMRQAWGNHITKILGTPKQFEARAKRRPTAAELLPDDFADKLIRDGIAAYLRGEHFRRHLTAPRGSEPKPASRNKKDANVPFVPVDLLDVDTAEVLGARSRVLRLTDPVVDKQYWHHGPGMEILGRRARDIRRNTVPVEWYADIPAGTRQAPPIQQKDVRPHRDGRWLFDFTIGDSVRKLVVDLDERKNPVVISYHGKE